MLIETIIGIIILIIGVMLAIPALLLRRLVACTIALILVISGIVLILLPFI